MAAGPQQVDLLKQMTIYDDNFISTDKRNDRSFSSSELSASRWQRLEWSLLQPLSETAGKLAASRTWPGLIASVIHIYSEKKEPRPVRLTANGLLPTAFISGNNLSMARKHRAVQDVQSRLLVPQGWQWSAEKTASRRSDTFLWYRERNDVVL